MLQLIPIKVKVKSNIFKTKMFEIGYLTTYDFKNVSVSLLDPHWNKIPHFQGWNVLNWLSTKHLWVKNVSASGGKTPDPPIRVKFPIYQVKCLPLR